MYFDIVALGMLKLFSNMPDWEASHMYIEK